VQRVSILMALVFVLCLLAVVFSLLVYGVEVVLRLLLVLGMVLLSVVLLVGYVLQLVFCILLDLSTTLVLGYGFQ
jgi:hypothetical protein